MKNDCNIVRDILPLFVEGMVSEDTSAYVNEHIKSCAECTSALKRLGQPGTVSINKSSGGDASALLSLRRKLVNMKIRTALFTAIFAVAVLVSAFSVLSAPNYFAYSGDLLDVIEGPGGLTIVFDEKVTDYSVNSARDADASVIYYHIDAWTSALDGLLPGRGARTLVIKAPSDAEYAAFYSQNNGMDDVLIYASENADISGGTRALPRLVLGYYALIIAIVFCALLAAAFIARKRPRARLCIERALIFPASYMLAHIIVMGFSTVSYAAARDFIMILAISVLLYSALLLAHSVYRIRKEINQISKPPAGRERARAA